MRRVSVWTIPCLMWMLILVGQTANGQVGKGIANGKKGGKTQSWRVSYEKGSPHPKTQDHAMRLEVSRPSATSNGITAVLSRYTLDDVTTPTKYVRRSESQGGIVYLAGTITKSGVDDKRKREDFILTGYYTNTVTNDTFRVTIKGFYWVGRDKTPAHAAARLDDQVCARVIHKQLASLAVAPASYTEGEPCDEQPPDEDVLTEEDAPTDPTEEPYDGG